jgi:hypothetical protein
LSYDKTRNSKISFWAYPALVLLGLTSRLLTLLSSNYDAERPIPKSHWKHVAIQTFIKLQAKLLDVLLSAEGESVNFQQAAVKYCQQPLVRSPAVFEDYMYVIIGSSPSTEDVSTKEPGLIPLLAVIAAHAIKHQPTAIQLHKDAILKFYYQQAVASRTKQPLNRLVCVR